MPARVLVYCKKPLARLTTDMLVAELRNADLMTLAEALSLPEGEVAAVKHMWGCFRLVTDDPSSIDGAEIHWHETHRPIQIRRAPPLDGEIDETLENLPAGGGAGAERVREHLKATREIVEFEMGIPGSLELAATIAEVLAFHVAEEGDGIVWFYHREFAAPDRRAATLWKTE